MGRLTKQHKIDEFVGKALTLSSSGAYSKRDAIPQVLNGANLTGNSESEKKVRRAYYRAVANRLLEPEELELIWAASPYYRRFKTREVLWGVGYAKNEFKRDLNYIALQMLADKIRRRMAEDDLTFEEIHRTDIEEEFRQWFREANKMGTSKEAEAELEAHISTVAKMFNNRQNSKKPGFVPDKRKGPKREKKIKIVAPRSGQLAWDFSK